jgi:hypothetical protein
MQPMGVTIISPIDNGNFPDNNTNLGWAAITTIDSADPVDGLIVDLSNDANPVYPSDNSFQGSGPDPDTNLYTWEVRFTGGAGINNGDSLLVYCYDAATGDNGDTKADTATANGPGGGYPASKTVSVKINGDPHLDSTTTPPSLTVAVKLTPRNQGSVHLLYGKRKAKPKFLSQPLPSMASEDQSVQFANADIDTTKWDYMRVIAAIKKHPSRPDHKKIK